MLKSLVTGVEGSIYPDVLYVLDKEAKVCYFILKRRAVAPLPLLEKFILAIVAETKISFRSYKFVELWTHGFCADLSPGCYLAYEIETTEEDGWALVKRNRIQISDFAIEAFRSKIGVDLRAKYPGLVAIDNGFGLVKTDNGFLFVRATTGCHIRSVFFDAASPFDAKGRAYVGKRVRNDNGRMCYFQINGKGNRIGQILSDKPTGVSLYT